MDTPHDIVKTSEAGDQLCIDDMCTLECLLIWQSYSTSRHQNRNDKPPSEESQKDFARYWQYLFVERLRAISLQII